MRGTDALRNAAARRPSQSVVGVGGGEEEEREDGMRIKLGRVHGCRLKELRWVRAGYY